MDLEDRRWSALTGERDGLVQSRINLSSTMVPKLVSGKGVVNILPGSIMCASSRKRQFGVDQETSAADYRT